MAQTQSKQAIFPDIALRAVALLMDLVPLGFVGALLGTYLPAPPYPFLTLVLLYFAVMPLTPWQGTLGKRICGIKLCDRSGAQLTWRSSAVRTGATLCWFAPPLLSSRIAPLVGLEDIAVSGIWWLVFALPWIPALFLPRRESLFDLLAGSLVVQYGAGAESIAGAEPAQKPGFLNVAGTLLVSLAMGAILSIVTSAYTDMDRRGRVTYAIHQTAPLRQKIEAFHEREQRWPTAGELGVPEWTPYRDGGGYRLQADGTIVITFSVLPELKGHSITSRPRRAADGKKILWQCSADAGFKPSYLPAACRE
jgi:uncharacterized RDD family membrane protein YckC